MSNVLEYAPGGAAILGAALVVGAVAQGRARWLVWAALCASVGVILWLTLGIAFGDGGGTGLNLTPLQEIRRALDNQGGSTLINLVGNVVMFVPIGALVAWLARRWRLATAVFVGFALSVVIEATQLSLGRVADVDDVILNTAGALLGAVLAVAFATTARALRSTPSNDR